MKSTQIVPGERPLLAIGYKYNSRKVLEFISTEGYGSTESGDPYLSSFPDMYYNVSVHPVVRPHLLGSYFNVCNAIYNQNRMLQSKLVLDKYLEKQSGYFRLTTTVDWVWVLHTGSSYSAMVFQREIWTRKIQRESTTTGRFMNASIIPFQLILVAPL